MASEGPPDAFLSYTRFDDQHDGGAISESRKRLASAVRAVTGEHFEIFQDVDGIGLGERWSGKLDEMLDQARFFIPIITPSYFKSTACRDELEKFLQAEADRGRADLVLPIYYIEGDALEDDDRRRADPLATAIHERQRHDWRELRFETFEAGKVRRELERLARQIAAARRRSMLDVAALRPSGELRTATAATLAVGQEELKKSSVVLASVPSKDEQSPTTLESLPRRPYTGLRPFEKSEWPIFHGRDRLIRDILTILARTHFVFVVGPSGSGKSSLIRAGVLATLERGYGRRDVRVRVGEMRPGASPLWSMAEGILRALRPDVIEEDGKLPADQVTRLRGIIEGSDNGLAVVIQELGFKGDESFVLLLDQFEEIFRYRPSEGSEERTRFLKALLAIANNYPHHVYIVVTMRSEYLGECQRFHGLPETINNTHYLMPRMSEEELRQAIVEPAKLFNGMIEEELVNKLIDDTASQEDALPILQHTLLWMWISEEEKRQREGLDANGGLQLGLADYEQLEARYALSRHGDQILQRLSAEEQKVAAVIFRRMVEVEEHSSRLRRPTRAGTVAALAEVSLDVVQRVLDAFRADDVSFIRVSRERVTENTSIDIIHESLIRQWSMLDRWVRREKASYEVYDNLCRAAQRMREGRGALLTGLELAHAQHWLCEEQPTRLWARRYGGDFDAACSFLMDSIEAEEQRQRALKEAEEAARRQADIGKS
jgi:energy-coupling factor transporter ATP-binding protein EcfA2